MNHRRPTLQASRTGLSSGTDLIDLDLADCISRIQVYAYGVNGDAIPDGHPAKFIESVEIIDGSEVVLSAEGRQLQAVEYFDTGRLPFSKLRYENGGTVIAVMSINFGRYLWDEEFALDPTKFKNLQLRIKYQKTGGGSSVASVNYNVLADVFDEKVISPIGYLQLKEIFKFTPASGTPKYIDLPTDMPIRKIILSSPSDTSPISAQIGTVVLDEDKGKRTLLDEIAYGLLRLYRTNYERFSEWVVATLNSSTRDVYIAAADHVGCGVINTGSGAGILYYTLSEGCKRTITGSHAAESFNAVFVGDCPHNALPIILGQQNVIEDWWDVTRIGEARLILTPTSGLDTGTDVSILVQRLARY